MGTYNLLKELHLRDERRPTMPESLVMGSVATGVAVLATYPIDTVGVTLRTQGMGSAAVEYPNIQAAVRGLYRAGGVRRFFDGLVPALKHVPALSIGYVVYETALTVMRWWDSAGGGEFQARQQLDTAWRRYEESQRHY